MSVQFFHAPVLISHPWVGCIALYAILLVAGCDCSTVRQPRAEVSHPQSAAAAKSQPLPAVRPSRFLNAKAEVQYVGNAACVACHDREFRSYGQTTHSRALQRIDLAHEPAGGEFRARHSGRTYRVSREGDEVWHRESVETATGESLTLDARRIDYAIGSGNHSRSYLAEIDGFLIESPITWYRATQSWGLSPGFEGAPHASFERMADSGCLICHAGRIEERNGNRFRVRIHESVIGCENCHGPGELHVRRHAEEQPPLDGDEDLTIVNPRSLTRAESEGICAQCHLRGDATVLVRGRTISDFRPGLQLADYRVDYFVEEPARDMEVVGHMEQMWRSRCYQQSAELTCVTCHDPHAPVSESGRIETYRQRCLSCHEPSACGVPEPRRRELNALDDCVACHMPRGATDIPHFAFTHHRIGIHEASQTTSSPAARFGRLLPSVDLSHLSEAEQQRLLGLAQVEWADKLGDAVLRGEYQNAARQNLEGAFRAGIDDPAVSAALARLEWERERLDRAQQLALASLRDTQESQRDVNALYILGDTYLRRGEVDLALPVFQQLVRQRRVSQDWFLLGMCQREQDDLPAALDSLRQAVAIDPTRQDALEMLVSLSRLTGRSDWEQQYLRQLTAVIHAAGQP